jgi:hypothetical protein
MASPWDYGDECHSTETGKFFKKKALDGGTIGEERGGEKMESSLTSSPKAYI